MGTFENQCTNSYCLNGSVISLRKFIKSQIKHVCCHTFFKAKITTTNLKGRGSFIQRRSNNSRSLMSRKSQSYRQPSCKNSSRVRACSWKTYNVCWQNLPSRPGTIRRLAAFVNLINMLWLYLILNGDLLTFITQAPQSKDILPLKNERFI